jgi:hypothetical protein
MCATMLRFALLASTLLCAGSGQAAESFAPSGASGTLTVDYAFNSSGSKADRNNSREWKIHRTVAIKAELTAGGPTPMPTLAPMDASMTADMVRRSERTQAVVKDMQPTLDEIHKIIAKCGEDDACLTRETMRFGMAADTGARLEKDRKSVDELTRAPVPRYQRWSAQQQSGSYTVDELVKMVYADPICQPSNQCRRSETRKGAGELTLPPGTDKRAAAGFSGIEVDSIEGTFTVLLPIPLAMLSIEEIIATDSPDRKSEAGKRNVQVDSGLANVKPVTQPLTIALKGSARTQSGSQMLDVTDAAGNVGKLTVKWKFAAN